MSGSQPLDDVLAADAVFAWNVRNRFLQDNWQRLDHLRWVHTASAGVERVLFPELVESDVVLTNSRFVFDQPMAEWVIGMMLVLSKDFRTTLAHQAQRRWLQRETDTLGGKVVVMVGVGPIARETARRIFGDRIEYGKKQYDVIEGADALVVVTEWNEFREPDFKRMKKLMKAPVIFDGRNIYNPVQVRELGFTYASIGRP